jgi:Skp family chaperone for outer membrane proteins
MMNRHARTLAIAALVALSGLWAAPSTPAAAQQSVPLVVGVVNADTIVDQSKAGKSLKAQAEQQQKAIKSDYQKQQKLFDDANQKLAAQSATLAPEDLQKKRADLQRQADSQSKSLTLRQRSLDQAFAKGQDQIVQVLVPVIRDVAKSHGLTLVITKGVTPYFDPSYDISAEVAQKLDAKLPSIKLPQASAASGGTTVTAPADTQGDAQSGTQ